MNIVTVTFHGAELYGFERPDGVYVALKPIVEAIGLDWSAQYRRVNRDPVLSEGVAIMAMPGAEQEVVCLRLDLLNGWLFGIDAGRVKDGAKRQAVLMYQRECFRALAARFLGFAGRPAIEPASQEPVPVRRSLVTEARQTYGVSAARELWVRLGLPITPAMGLAPAQGELFQGGANG